LYCRVCNLMALSFFFSSRRRHTRCYRDWSSDVCSSDLDTLSAGTFNVTVTGTSGPISHSTIVTFFVQPPPTFTAKGFFVLTTARSEERRVGKECRYRWSRSPDKESRISV